MSGARGQGTARSRGRAPRGDKVGAARWHVGRREGTQMDAARARRRAPRVRGRAATSARRWPRAGGGLGWAAAWGEVANRARWLLGAVVARAEATMVRETTATTWVAAAELGATAAAGMRQAVAVAATVMTAAAALKCSAAAEVTTAVGPLPQPSLISHSRGSSLRSLFK